MEILTTRPFLINRVPQIRRLLIQSTARGFFFYSDLYKSRKSAWLNPGVSPYHDCDGEISTSCSIRSATTE